MSKVLFDDPRKLASIVAHALVRQLHDLQDRIIRIERFGKNAVLHPGFGVLNDTVYTRDQLLQEHDELVAQIRALNEARDKASGQALAQFVAGLRRK
jgi:hypothetical protein